MNELAAQPTLAATLAAIDATQIVMLALAVVMLTMVMLSTRRKIRKSMRGPEEGVRERYDKLKAERRASRDLEEIMIDLDKLAREVNGKIDTRLAHLEALIRDADQRIETMRKMRDELSTQSSPVSSPQKGRPAGDAAATKKKQKGAATKPKSAPAIDITLGDETDPPSAAPAPSDGNDANIYRLADAGMTPIEIAQELGRGTGEIELVLSLRKAKAHAK